jgi:hypothetical protein
MTHPTLIGLVMLMSACSPSDSAKGPRGSLSTSTDSQTLPDQQQRIAFLSRYVTPKSPIRDTEFIIHYQDNSGGLVPGPSD